MRKKGRRKKGSSRPGRDSFPGKTNPNRQTTGGDSSSSCRTPRPFPVKYDLAEPRETLNEDQRLLVMKYLPLADAVVRASCRSKRLIKHDELQSTAYMALVEAARSYDPARKVNFATYARYHMTGALRSASDSGLVLDGGETRAYAPLFRNWVRTPTCTVK